MRFINYPQQVRIKYGLILILTVCNFFKSYSQEEWTIVASPVDNANYYGVSTSNGVVGILSSPEPLKCGKIMLAGAYDHYGRGRVNNFLDGINMMNLRLRIDNVTISQSNITDYKQVLNMKTGALECSFTLPGKAVVTYSYLALRHLPHSMMLDVKIEPLTEIDITAANEVIVPDLYRDLSFTYNEINRKHIGINLMSTHAMSPSGRLKLVATSSFLFNEKRMEEPKVSHETPDNNRHLIKFQKKIAKGEPYLFSVVGTLISTAQVPDPSNECERLSIYALSEGREPLLARHKTKWNELWESDIIIDGDPVTQKEVRSMLYHLYSFSREGSDYSLSPMGLSGLGYNGHVFWDAETWIFPALLVLNPELARPMIEYRYNLLQSAKKNAFNHGYKGAMFPWESADSGFEETPVWALAGTFEHHISACVALAAWDYYCVTQDIDWLREKGYPMIKETADFWCSRVDKNPAGYYEIKNVVAADEWAENVDNDAYTNAAAIKNLKIATDASKLLGVRENKMWKRLADSIVIHRFPDGITREHNTYNGEPIKQADVNLLAYPLRHITDHAQIKRDLDYYVKKVPDNNTPAMTHSIFSLLYAKLGDKHNAYEYFKKSFKPNMQPPFSVIAETKGGTNPYFITGAGGTLQSVLMGFGGLEITPAGLKKNKGTLPVGWRKLTLKGIGKDKKSYVIQ